MFFEEISLFTRRAHEKNKKHLNGCIDLGRHFIPLVFSSLAGGLGPPESVEYLDRLYAHAYATELRLGGNGSDTHHQRTIFYQTLQAILANHSTTMIHEDFLFLFACALFRGQSTKKQKTNGEAESRCCCCCATEPGSFVSKYGIITAQVQKTKKRHCRSRSILKYQIPS